MEPVTDIIINIFSEFLGSIFVLLSRLCGNLEISASINKVKSI